MYYQKIPYLNSRMLCGIFIKKYNFKLGPGEWNPSEATAAR